MSARPALSRYPDSLSPPCAQPSPRGAEILINALVHEGVDSIFGYPGGAVLHIYDELWRARDRITHYLVRHEQGAVHMAEGYARASGRVGVALVTSGPGATNAVTGKIGRASCRERVWVQALGIAVENATWQADR